MKRKAEHLASSLADAIRVPVSEIEIPQIDQIELLFFAYRDFTADPDRILERLGMGRAHHRALYFINRRPGMTVAELISILSITKQSLARVLRELLGAGYICQITGDHDRRQRHLYPTQSGRKLILELSAPQSRRIEAALREGGIAEPELIARFMRAMIGPSKGGGSFEVNYGSGETTS
jgi:DNA-binding MarR family transcriptional regulator